MNEEILVKCKNGVWGLLSCITSILFTHYFFVGRNFYDSDPILYMDHAGHLAFSIIYGESVLGQFFASYGYTYMIHNGFPFIPFFSTGYFFIIYLIHLLGFNYETSYKITLFLLMVFSGIVPYLSMRICNKPPVVGFVGTIWFWIGMPSFILRRFNTGGITMVLAAALGILFILYSLKLDFKTRPKVFLTKQELSLVILLFCVAFIHIVAVIVIFLVIAEIISGKLIKSKSFTDEIKQMILIYAKIGLMAIGLLAFWILPTIVTHSGYSTIDPAYYLTSYEYSLVFNSNYVQRTYLPLIGVFSVAGFLYFRFQSANDLQLNAIFLILLNCCVIVFLLPLTRIPILVGIFAYRYLIYLEFACALMIPYFYSEIKKVWEKWAKIRKSQILNDSRLRIKKEIILALLLIPLTLLGIFPLTGDNAIQILYGNPEVNYTEWTAEEQDIMAWIQSNTTSESRILFQNSGHETGWQIGRGHSILYMALLTNRSYATGYTSQWYYTYAKETNFEDSVLYGKPLIDYTWETLEPILALYNIEFIIVWTKIAVEFFNQTSFFAGEVELIYNNSEFFCFQYLSAPKSYIILEQNLTISEFSLEQKAITFKITEPIMNLTRIILSFHDYSNWKVYINGQSVPKYQNAQGLIEFIIEPEFNVDILEIQVLWKRTPIEIIGDLISSLTLIGCICLIVSLLRKKVNIKK